METTAELNPQQRERLEVLMRRLDAAGGMNLEALDGLSTAFVALGVELGPQDWLSVLEAGVEEAKYLLGPDEMEELTGLVVALQDSIVDRLYEHRKISPILFPCDDVTPSGSAWSGFFLDCLRRSGELERIPEEHTPLLVPLMALAEECLPVDENAEEFRAISPEERKEYIEYLPQAALGVIYSLWAAQEKESRAPGKSAKIPRNSPCPCGSGKKYKKCCLGRRDDFNNEADAL